MLRGSADRVDLQHAAGDRGVEHRAHDLGLALRVDALLAQSREQSVDPFGCDLVEACAAELRNDKVAEYALVLIGRRALEPAFCSTTLQPFLGEVDELRVRGNGGVHQLLLLDRAGLPSTRRCAVVTWRP
jgi:hypothetical protein